MNNTTEKFADFHTPEVKIYVDGRKISSLGIDVSEVKIEQILDGADSFSFTVPQALDEEFNPRFPDVFQFGNKVEIHVGYRDRLFPAITGIINSVSWDLTEGNYIDITVEGYDYLFLLMKKEKHKSWNDKKDSEVVKEILQKYPFKRLDIEDTRIRHPHIRQEGETDFHFLKRLAKRNGFEYLVEGETFYFRPPAVDKKPAFSLTFGKELFSFNPQFNIAQQVSEVQVIGWDPKSKKEIKGIAKKEDENKVERKGETGADLIKSILKEEVVHQVRAPVYSIEEAERLAKSILNELSYGLIKGECKSFGLPGLRPGQVIELKRLGKMFSRRYYVEKVTHDIGENGYETNFSVRGNTYHESI